MSLQTAPLTYVTPSSAELLRACFLNVYWNRHSGRRGQHSPPSLIGSAAHAVLAEAATGALAHLDADTFSHRFDLLWEEAIGKQEKYEPRYSPTQSLRHVRTYEITRARTKAAAQAFVIAVPGQTVLIEEQFTAYSGMLRGQPDRVTVTTDFISIEDFKTGTIYEPNSPDGKQRVKESYRRQLLLYAALVQERFLRWPDSASLVTLDGNIEVLEVDPEEATAVADDALALLHHYNQRIASISQSEDLATPASDACSFCGHVLWCEPYWKAVAPQWGDNTPNSIEGTVLASQSARNGLVTLKVAIDRGTVSSGSALVTQLDQARVTGLDSVVIGTRLRLTNLQARGASFIPSWSTQLRILS